MGACLSDFMGSSWLKLPLAIDAEGGDWRCRSILLTSTFVKKKMSALRLARCLVVLSRNEK